MQHVFSFTLAEAWAFLIYAAGAAAGDQGGTDEFTEMLRRRQDSALSRSASSG